MENQGNLTAFHGGANFFQVAKQPVSACPLGKAAAPTLCSQSLSELIHRAPNWRKLVPEGQDTRTPYQFSTLLGWSSLIRFLFCGLVITNTLRKDWPTPGKLFHLPPGKLGLKTNQVSSPHATRWRRENSRLPSLLQRSSAGLLAGRSERTRSRGIRGSTVLGACSKDVDREGGGPTTNQG